MSRYAMQMKSFSAVRQSGCSVMPSAASLSSFAGIAAAMSVLFFPGGISDRLRLPAALAGILVLFALPVFPFPVRRKGRPTR